MAKQISLSILERKASVINRDFGTDIEVERFNGAYRACCNKGSKNLTPLTTKNNLWAMLDALEEGLHLGVKLQKEKDRLAADAFNKSSEILGCMTGRTSSNKSNIKEIDKDGRQGTDCTGKQGA